MSKTVIAPFKRIKRKIYGYALPDVPSHVGLVKVGQTEQDNPRKRVEQQTGTVGVNYEYLFHRNAIRNDYELFRDTDLHAYYRLRGIERAVLNNKATEWFNFGDLSLAEQMADDYINSDYTAVQIGDKYDYILRPEQEAAVKQTLAYWADPVHGSEFLWNAKPRFGKTLTCYDFMRRINAQNVLIVTNRPAIANSWFDDFQKFIAWQEPGMKFVSETDALSKRNPMSRKDFIASLQSIRDAGEEPRCLAFISLQDLKGAKIAGGDFDKLEWVFGMDWDLLIIDEAHEGIDTQRTDRAFESIQKKKFTLHLSGTPFKAIANQKFHSEQIYNWSYLDEQLAKTTWDDSHEGTNPYASLPTLNLFTYQMSEIIQEELAKGIQLDDETNLDYAFNLNEFFSTDENGNFVYENEVKRFLDRLHTGKYPFADEQYKKQLNHTFWLLNRVDSAKAMEVLLKNHPFFKDYTVVLAAGDGRSFEEEQTMDELETTAMMGVWNKRSFDRVREAIASNEKTITLSVGQLTTGVTVPEWTAIFMLSDIKSPALYFQAAFRAQNPWEFQDPNSKEWYNKENAYIFDFAPDRTLVLFDEFANNLHDTGAKADISERKENIRELINFFPVIAEDEDGSLHEISVDDVLTIPLQLKAQEVVRRGFMSNLLFANISAIFAAPAQLKAILDKIRPEKNKRLQSTRDIDVPNIMMNEKSEVKIPRDIVINTSKGIFGDAIYRTDVEATLEKFSHITEREENAQKVARDLINKWDEGFEKVRDDYGLTRAVQKQQIRETEALLTSKIEENLFQAQERKRLATNHYEEQAKEISEPALLEAHHAKYEAQLAQIETELQDKVLQSLEEVSQHVVEKQIVRSEEKKKKNTEDDVRDHLRGFARTIPAFLMAYGSPETTLANYDENIHAETFEELTSITLDEFRQLRDGIEYENEDGETVSVPGLFNETVFNSSIQEFFRIKDKLADYLHTQHEEDIFSYIPPQRTNQIFTPRKVVKMMVDTLQENDPDLFNSKETKFIDLYAKSGLYLTEIARRLFAGLADEIPDENARVKWILEKQLYACAPGNIIYKIVRNYVYAGFDDVDDKNIIECDLVEDAKEGRIKAALAERFGKDMKFDVIIGNPPYQESYQNVSGNIANAKSIYNLFMEEAIKLKPKFISMITPSKWMTKTSQGIPAKWVEDTIKSNKFRIIHDFEDPSVCFPDNISIMGGVNYFLWEDSYFGKCEYFFYPIGSQMEYKKMYLDTHNLGFVVRSPKAHFLIEKIVDVEGEYYNIDTKSFTSMVSPKDFFNNREVLTSNWTGYSNYSDEEHTIKCYLNEQLQAGGIGWMKPSDLVKNKETVPLDKVYIPAAHGSEVQILGVPFYGEPNSVSSQTYLVIGYDPEKHNLEKEECENIIKYIKTVFFRYLVSIKKKTQNGPRGVYQFVPVQDFSNDSDIDWDKPIADINQQLYKKYHFSDEEIAFIEQLIRPME